MNAETKSVSLSELKKHVGSDLGPTEWLEVTQEDVNTFATVTRDEYFIHVDPRRAASTPFGTTIAHGFYALSLLSYFGWNGAGLGIKEMVFGLNYGFDKVRFLSPIPVGCRLRALGKLVSADETSPGQYRLRYEISIEIEGQAKPALYAEWLTLVVVS